MRQGIQHIINYFFWAFPSFLQGLQDLVGLNPRRVLGRAFRYIFLLLLSLITSPLRGLSEVFLLFISPLRDRRDTTYMLYRRLRAQLTEVFPPTANTKKDAAAIPNVPPLWGDVFLQEKDRGAFKIPNY